MPLFGRHQPPLNQRGFERIVADVADSMMGDPGLRLAATTGRSYGTYSGGELQPQKFLRPPAGPNDVGSLETVPLSINARRALNRQRGRPGA